MTKAVRVYTVAVVVTKEIVVANVRVYIMMFGYGDKAQSRGK